VSPLEKASRSAQAPFYGRTLPIVNTRLGLQRFLDGEIEQSPSKVKK
jgi:hypothetical protein